MSENAFERWGFKWRGHDHGTHILMSDGYWTPWHVATTALAASRAREAKLREALVLAESWCQLWAVHVPMCDFSSRCQCRLNYVREQITAALSASEAEQFEEIGDE